MSSAKPAAKALVLENTEKRDALIREEKRIQKEWQDAKLFETDAPTTEEIKFGTDPDDIRTVDPKFFGSMAYPYMNGVLHAGHSFTLSKIEFNTGWERMNGRRALFPLGFHCTGMPIKACADKLQREIEMFGPDFEGYEKYIQDHLASEEGNDSAESSSNEAGSSNQFGSKKSKAAAKQGTAKFQFQIMIQTGIPRNEVKQFADPQHWLEYFPPLCQKHCNAFGARIDWRRSFLTTDANPYYDAFVRWQMNKLHELNKIKFGERYTIYSEKDGQPCMDHDRQTGEGVKPQEYTAIKIKILDFAPTAKEALKNVDLKGKNIYLIAATLRPETMYGQTTCFVSPFINYGIYELSSGDLAICTERAIKNMAFQKLTPVRGKYPAWAHINGKLLVGSKIHAPLSVYPEVYVLPMETVKESKGTGVVTSVPSDSPDDYATVIDLAKKADYYGIKKEWASLEPIPIINTPTYGDLTAVELVKQFKINSPKDTQALAKAKELAYKEGFYQGTMVIGKYKGDKVEVAKNKVRQDLIDSGDAFVYDEPEGVVVSRSGDICIVALEDQWYLDYGEPEWRKKTELELSRLDTHGDETRHGFEATLSWLRNWACARSYGLGSKLPWDTKFLVESLSDSTVYMAYYTVAHYLHSDVFGKTRGKGNVSADQMTDEVWDYIFCRVDNVPSDSTIPLETLHSMRREFEYFYPVDLRVSGKDLVPNHLSFFLYIHTALFKERYWPRGIRANGHLLLNNEKMSKSSGNFMTLEQTIEKFGADATRITLADAGDGVEDANFDESTANAVILRLYTLREWAKEMVQESKNPNSSVLRVGKKDNFFDLAFENELNQLIEETRYNYDGDLYKQAVKTGLYDFQAARDYYRDATALLGVNMHRDLVLKYIELQALLITPVAPHWAEYIYMTVLGKKESVQLARYPEISKPINLELEASLEYVRNLVRSIREIEGANLKKAKKGKSVGYDVHKSSKLSIIVATDYPAWQHKYIDLVRDLYKELANSKDKELPKDLPKRVQQRAIESKVPQEGKKAIPFVNNIKQQITTSLEHHHNDDPVKTVNIVLNRKLQFNEVELLKTIKPLLDHVIHNCVSVNLLALTGPVDSSLSTAIVENILNPNDAKFEIKITKDVESAIPGEPGIILENI